MFVYRGHMRVSRKKPSTRAARKRAVELRAILNHPRTRKAERLAAVEELDRISPPVAPQQAEGAIQ
jgi:hypothetical protein